MKKFFLGQLAILSTFVLLLTSCGEETHQWETVLFEAGTINATVNGQERDVADSIRLDEGMSVTYTDLSTNQFSRNWVFQGGTPATSTDSVVTVMYRTGGKYKATLMSKYRDNQTKTISYNVKVVGIPNDYGVTYGIFTDDPSITMMPNSLIVQNINQFPGEIIADAFEGTKAYKFTPSGTSDWAMASLNAGSAVDLSTFASGFYNIAVRSTSLGNILIRVRSGGGGNAVLRFTAAGEEYGFKRDGAWHMLKIPVSALKTLDVNFNIASVTDFVLLRSEGDVRTFENYIFYVDNVFFSTK